VQSTIEAISSSLPPSEHRVADQLRANPSIVLTHTITELAEASQTSVATVVRFCRSIGLPGYSHLRMRLATELGMEAAWLGPVMNSGADIRPEDTLAESVEKIAGLEKLAIDETARDIDIEQLAQLGELLDEASRILCFGMGSSHAVAEDLAKKLARIDHNAVCPQDVHDALTRAILMPPDSVTIGFSHSGNTTETRRCLQIAHQQGSTTVAVTSVPDSPITREADIVVRTVARDTSFRAGAMVARIAQLCVVDLIFVAVARRHYDETLGALKLASQAISP